MANYLVQAMYGQKASAPSIKAEPVVKQEHAIKQEPVSGERVSSLSNNIEIAPNLTSPVMFNQSFQNLQKQSSMEQQHVHAARQQLMESNEPLEEKPHEEEIRRAAQWRPTGSNVLPIVKKSTPVVHVVSTTPIATLGPPISPKPSLTWLKAAPVRYLPPPCDYYDQHMLVSIFGPKYFNPDVVKARCFNCRTPTCPLRLDWQGCKLPCGVCKTKKHPGKGCCMLYCSFSWYASRSSTGYSSNLQIRPTLWEAKYLAQIGLIQNNEDNTEPIVPIMSHHIAQQFYSKGPKPQALTHAVIHRRPPPIPKVHPTMIPSRNNPPTSSVVAKAKSGLDPRLRERVGESRNVASSPSPDGLQVADPKPSFTRFDQPYRFHSVASTEATEPAAEKEAPPHQLIGTSLLRERLQGLAMESQSEVRIQELEDQVLDLQRAVVSKDREIRKLKTDLDLLQAAQMQGDEYKSGSKRPRYDAVMRGA